MSRPSRLLQELVAALVAEWGPSAVARAVEQHSATEGSATASARETKPSKPKPTAVELVLNTDVPESRRQVLMELAKRFDDKTFLPRAADIRNFLEMRGQSPGAVKQRTDAFRPLLRVMLRLPDEKLIRLAQERIYSGPSQLGPIADAIRDAGPSRRLVSETDDGLKKTGS